MIYPIVTKEFSINAGNIYSFNDVISEAKYLIKTSLKFKIKAY